MMKLQPSSACPCHSGRSYRSCCQASHKGRPAEKPEALMRSRYAAYALGLADYIIQTTAASSSHFRADTRAWREDILAFHKETFFVNLLLLGSGMDAEARSGWVSFHAVLMQNGRDASFIEESRFIRPESGPQKNRWLYLDGRLTRPGSNPNPSKTPQP